MNQQMQPRRGASDPGPLLYDPRRLAPAQWTEHALNGNTLDAALTSGDFSADRVPDAPWALISVTATGVVATAHPMWQRTLLWAEDGLGRFAISHRLQELVDWLPVERRALTHDFALRWLTASQRGGTTPFAHIHAVSPGTVLRIDSAGAVRTHQWLSEDDLPAPQLRGPRAVAQYLAAFDATVQELVGEQDALAVRMSGGLDSTFVASAVARCRGPVHAYVHTPLADGRFSVGPLWDVDDWPNAEAMRDYLGRDRLILHRVRPEIDGSTPLDWGEAHFRSSYSPLFNACNLRWIEESNSLARAAGAKAIFVGANGNAAFSDPHRAALAAAVRCKRWGLATRIGIAELHGRLGQQQLRGVARKVRRGLADPGAVPGGRSVCRWLTNEADEQVRVWRGDILAQADWGRKTMLGGRPRFAGEPGELPKLDPFTSIAVIRAAAAIAPDEWIRGPAPRGFARRAAQGRVPDAVRLRTQLGAQGIDAWAHMQPGRETYIAEARAIAESPLADIIDSERLAAAVQAWPWGSRIGPADADVVSAERVLNLARFLRWHRNELPGGLRRT